MRWLLFLLALTLGTALDLGTKAVAFHHLPTYGQSQQVTSWFAFTHAQNRGAAFGMFQGQHDFFMVVTVVAIVAVTFFVHTAPRRARAIPIVLGLILAGVAGNFWDRVTHGFVRDFIDVHTPPAGALHDFFMATVGRTVWPTFNIADIFITCGAVAMVLFFGREEQTRDSPAPAPPKGDAASAQPTDEQPAAPTPETATEAAT
ncbi:MAG: signal peptidase II [Planctomycetes bacterium]|nr:signal peptidase II [Planctomycetota bacterium]